MFKPREVLLKKFNDKQAQDVLSDAEKDYVKQSGYLFLIYLMEASGIYESRDVRYNEAVTAEDEARVVFL